MIWIAIAVALLLGLASLLYVRLTSHDSCTFLTILLVALLLIPEPDTVSALKSYGNPAVMLGVGCLLLWAAGRWLGNVTAQPRHPIRWLMWVLAVSSMAEFAAGMARPLVGQEGPGALRSACLVACLIGITLLATDTLRAPDQVETVLRRLVMLVAVSAFIGIIEFFDKGFRYAAVVQIPGITPSDDAVLNIQRGGYNRIMVAAAHPIEYSVMLAVMTPIALHYAIHATGVAKRRARIAFIVICLAVPLSISRSGIVAMVLGLTIYAIDMKGRGRINLAVIGIIGMAATRAVAPGLLSTLLYLFTAGNSDPSIASRTNDYSRIPALLDGHLLLGRGLGTFNPVQYFFLDDQYLGSLLEGGIVGLSVLVALFLVGMSCARGIRKRAMDRATRSLGQALAGSVAALAVSAGTFDEFGFHETVFILFILLGCIGALWTHTRNAQEAAAQRSMSEAVASKRPVA